MPYKNLIDVGARYAKKRILMNKQVVRNDNEGVNSSTIENVNRNNNAEVHPGCSTWNFNLLNSESASSAFLVDEDLDNQHDMSPESNSKTEFEVDSSQDCGNFIATWSIRHGVSHNALNELLCFLKNNGFPELPKDSRTLLKTPKSSEIEIVEPGQYVHIGLKNGIDNILIKSKQMPEEIKVNFNIDGVPLSKSSSSCFWPILAKTSISKIIIVVGIYHGYGQPQDFNKFLRTFVDELLIMIDNYEFHDKTIPIRIGVFILDTPARAHVLGIKSHAAYFGCPRCCQEGEYLGRITFPELNAQKRSNDSFRERRDENHHNKDSILEELNINMISQFTLDYMHVVLLGVMKKMLKMWTSGTIESLLPSRCISQINNLLKKIEKTQPSEFQRRIQVLNHLSQFKATEFRTFLLYSGPFVLRCVLPKSKYDHFMLLHTAISLLCSPSVEEEIVDFARELIKQFITGMKSLYGPHHIVFNVHALLHIPDDVLKYGPLDNISAFEFESFMFKLQKMLRKKDKPLSQIFNRIVEMNNIAEISEANPTQYPILKKASSNVNAIIYNEVISRNFRITNSIKNCWVLTDQNEILKFIHAVKIDNIIMLYASEVLEKTNFYHYPVASSKLKTFKTSTKEANPKLYPLETIVSKMFYMENSAVENV